LQSLPEYSKAKPLAKGSGRTCFELFEAYVTAVQPRPSTVNRWRVVFTTLDEHLDGRKIDHFSNDEAQQWATSLVTERRGARTSQRRLVDGRQHRACVGAETEAHHSEPIRRRLH